MEEWQRVLDFNLSGTFLFCNAVVPHMKRQGNGKIVNFASIAGRGKSATSSSALLGGQGRDHRHDDQAGSRTRAVRDQCECDRPVGDPDQPHPPTLGRHRSGRAAPTGAVAGTPLRRIAEPIDQANVVCFLASSHADFVTGVTIDVTGGA